MPTGTKPRDREHHRGKPVLRPACERLTLKAPTNQLGKDPTDQEYDTIHAQIILTCDVPRFRR